METSRQTKLAHFPEEKQPVSVQFLKENKPRWRWRMEFLCTPEQPTPEQNQRLDEAGDACWG